MPLACSITARLSAEAWMEAVASRAAAARWELVTSKK
jgi:hypothetical protein